MFLDLGAITIKNVFYFKEIGNSAAKTYISLVNKSYLQTNQAEIFPNVGMVEQVTEADSVLVLTCIGVLSKSDGEIKWEVPRITKYKEVKIKLHYLNF